MNEGANALGRLIEYSPGMGSVIMALGCTSSVTPRPLSEVLYAPPGDSVSLLNEVDAAYGSTPISQLRFVDFAEASSLDLVEFLETREGLRASGRVVGEARRAQPVEFDWSL